MAFFFWEQDWKVDTSYCKYTGVSVRGFLIPMVTINSAKRHCKMAPFAFELPVRPCRVHMMRLWVP